MRVLFLIPGGIASQLQALPAVATVAASLKAQIQVACAPEAAGSWKLLPAVEKVLPFNFQEGSTLADWANLLGNVREPDFQVCLNLASGRQVDLMLSMSHIPTRVAAGGFSATERIDLDPGLWPQQALAAYLRPLGIGLDANSFRLALPKAALDKAGAALPPGQGPALLLAPASAARAASPAAAPDWPAAQWQGLQERVRQKLADLRVVTALPGACLVDRAAQLAGCDVVLSSDPIESELALLTGTPLVALGREPASLPQRPGVQGLGGPDLAQLSLEQVLQALGLG
ncbi:MAG: lipopolysaccharide heptosyltransferase family protein [Cyanobacteria bacterium]|nr:lipopolysaccharide heptosyltransferase family protein [Cyanobacteriota bacterium]